MPLSPLGLLCMLIGALVVKRGVAECVFRLDIAPQSSYTVSGSITLIQPPGTRGSPLVFPFDLEEGDLAIQDKGYVGALFAHSATLEACPTTVAGFKDELSSFFLWSQPSKYQFEFVRLYPSNIPGAPFGQLFNVSNLELWFNASDFTLISTNEGELQFTSTWTIGTAVGRVWTSNFLTEGSVDIGLLGLNSTLSSVGVLVDPESSSTKLQLDFEDIVIMFSYTDVLWIGGDSSCELDNSCWKLRVDLVVKTNIYLTANLACPDFCGGHGRCVSEGEKTSCKCECGWTYDDAGGCTQPLGFCPIFIDIRNNSTDIKNGNGDDSNSTENVSSPGAGEPPAMPSPTVAFQGGCPVGYMINTTLGDLSTTCVPCAQGYTGPSCAFCTSDSVCRAKEGSATARCQRGVQYFPQSQGKDYFCSVEDPSITDLLGDTVSFACSTTSDENRIGGIVGNQLSGASTLPGYDASGSQDDAYTANPHCSLVLSLPNSRRDTLPSLVRCRAWPCRFAANSSDIKCSEIDCSCPSQGCLVDGQDVTATIESLSGGIEFTCGDDSRMENSECEVTILGLAETVVPISCNATECLDSNGDTLLKTGRFLNDDDESAKNAIISAIPIMILLLLLLCCIAASALNWSYIKPSQALQIRARGAGGMLELAGAQVKPRKESVLPASSSDISGMAIPSCTTLLGKGGLDGASHVQSGAARPSSISPTGIGGLDGASGGLRGAVSGGSSAGDGAGSGAGNGGSRAASGAVRGAGYGGSGSVSGDYSGASNSSRGAASGAKIVEGVGSSGVVVELTSMAAGGGSGAFAEVNSTAVDAGEDVATEVESAGVDGGSSVATMVLRAAKDGQARAGPVAESATPKAGDAIDDTTMASLSSFSIPQQKEPWSPDDSIQCFQFSDISVVCHESPILHSLRGIGKGWGGGRSATGTASSPTTPATPVLPHAGPGPVAEGISISGGILYDPLEDCEMGASTKSSHRNGKRILHPMSSSANVGGLVGILGPSGSGKSTLINVLSGTVQHGGKWEISGSVTLDGTPVAPSSMAQLSAHVPQHDLIMRSLTVEECLRYSAAIRLDARVSAEAVAGRMESVLAELGIKHIRSSMCWKGSSSQISGGERTRVSIGMELVTDPHILMLDEPTSGLDSYTAHQLMLLLQRVAEGVSSGSQRIIIASIHQPSPTLFNMLDKVLLLAQGHIIYDGAPTGVEAAFVSFDLPMAAGVSSIAEHMLECVANPATVGILQQRVAASKVASLLSMVPAALRAVGATEWADDTSRNAAMPKALKQRQRSLLREFGVIFWRTAIDIVRNPMLAAAHCVFAIIAGLALGFSYYQANADIAGAQNRVGGTFSSLVILAFTSVSAMDIIQPERMLVSREVSRHFYSPLTYMTTKIVVDGIFLRTIPAVLFAVPMYWLMGLRPTAIAFFTFQWTLASFSAGIGCLCLCVANLTSSPGTAVMLSNALLFFGAFLSGFLVNLNSLTWAIRWASYLSPFRYAWGALVSNELAYLSLNFSTAELPNLPAVSGSLFLSLVGIDADDLDPYVIAVVVLYGGFAACAVLTMWLRLKAMAKGWVDP